MGGLEGMNQEFCFGHAKFEMLIRHLYGNIKEAAEHVSRVEGWDIHVGVLSIEMLLKNMELVRSLDPY